jgi:hypothetical protein
MFNQLMDPRTPLSTFAFSKPASFMTEDELTELADKILDQWSRDIATSTPPFLQGKLTR